jgi:hypothetical protein
MDLGASAYLPTCATTREDRTHWAGSYPPAWCVRYIIANGYGEETAEWSLSSTPAAGEAPRLKVGTGTGSGATSCGEELSGSQDTSCPFAHEVLKAFVAEYVAKGVPPANIIVQSPVTHRTYALKCEIVYTWKHSRGGQTETRTR